MQDEHHSGPRPAERGRAAQTGTSMGRVRRFWKRINEPSSVQIVHELKLMALRQSLDAAVTREAGETLPVRGEVGNVSPPGAASAAAPRPDAS